jgi:exodeoxyribonuclease-3
MLSGSSILRIGCWNVNSIRVRMPLVESWLKTEAIDVALLQETKVTDDLFPEKAFLDQGYYSAFWGQKSYNGVAILSRWPLIDVQRHDFNKTGCARYIQALTQGVRVASIYVPQGQGLDRPAYQEKLDFVQGLTHQIQPHVQENRCSIIGGDYNIAPYDEDVWDPALWHNRVTCSVLERQAFQRILWMGWSEAEVTHRGKPNPYTWWAYQHGAWPKKQGLRIDSFLLSPSAADAFKDTGVSSHWRGAFQTSDHAPIWLDICHHSNLDESV